MSHSLIIMSHSLNIILLLFTEKEKKIEAEWSLVDCTVIP
jgi:hypothetical protein